MKVLFLCAGYGTRLEADLKSSGEFPELIGRPKGLLPVGEEALIGYWFDALAKLDDVKHTVIVTNDKFTEQFYKSKKWYAKNYGKEIEIINDGSTCNETRLGAVTDIKFALDNMKSNDPDEDLLVIAGDTLFMKDFDLNAFVSKFKALKESKTNLSLIVECPCPEQEVHKHGIIEVNQDKKVTSFLEKPEPKETKSRSQSPCFYLFDGKCQAMIADFLSKNQDKCDATGNFLTYLIAKAEVYAFPTRGRYDVGNLNSYKACLKDFLHQ